VTFESFPGYPPFLAVAAAELGCAEAADPARRVSTLTAMANLCAQAAVAHEQAVPGILAKAQEFHDQLRVATRAAELMLDSIRASRGAREPVALRERPRGLEGSLSVESRCVYKIASPNTQRPAKGRSKS
jgi:hypothetical protein